MRAAVTPDRFPDVFAEGWALPKLEPFLDYFLPLIDPDAVFLHPMYPVARGRAQVAAMFRQLFSRLPDLTALPVRTATSGDTAIIESHCTATLGRRSVTFEVCDSFVIRNSLIVHRHSYSDPIPVLRALLIRPAAWPRAVRSRFPAKSPTPR